MPHHQSCSPLPAHTHTVTMMGQTVTMADVSGGDDFKGRIDVWPAAAPRADWIKAIAGSGAGDKVGGGGLGGGVLSARASRDAKPRLQLKIEDFIAVEMRARLWHRGGQRVASAGVPRGSTDVHRRVSALEAVARGSAE